MKKSPFFFLALLIQSSAAAPLTIVAQNSFGGFSSNPFNDRNGDPLPEGSLVQLGYFLPSEAPSSSSDSFDSFTSIEADAAAISLGVGGVFSQDVNLDSSVLPEGTPTTLQFAYRFFDGPDLSSASLYNTVTTSSWEFSFSDAVPPPPSSEMAVDPIGGASVLPTLVWESGDAGAFNTTVVIPEPSTSLALALGLSLLLGRRQRG